MKNRPKFPNGYKKSKKLLDIDSICKDKMNKLKKLLNKENLNYKTYYNESEELERDLIFLVENRYEIFYVYYNKDTQYYSLTDKSNNSINNISQDKIKEVIIDIKKGKNIENKSKINRTGIALEMNKGDRNQLKDIMNELGL